MAGITGDKLAKQMPSMAVTKKKPAANALAEFSVIYSCSPSPASSSRHDAAEESLASVKPVSSSRHDASEEILASVMPDSSSRHNAAEEILAGVKPISSSRHVDAEKSFVSCGSVTPVLVNPEISSEFVKRKPMAPLTFAENEFAVIFRDICSKVVGEDFADSLDKDIICSNNDFVTFTCSQKADLPQTNEADKHMLREIHDIHISSDEESEVSQEEERDGSITADSDYNLDDSSASSISSNSAVTNGSPRNEMYPPLSLQSIRKRKFSNSSLMSSSTFYNRSSSVQAEVVTERNVKRKRRGIARPETWQVNVRQKRRMLGQSYEGIRQLPTGQKELVKRAARKMGERCNCKFMRSGSANIRCAELSDELRFNIFQSFWREKDVTEKKQFVAATIAKKTPIYIKNRKEKDKSRRKFTLAYHLPNEENELVQVCKKMYLNTLSAKFDMVYGWLDKELDVSAV